MKLLRLTSDQVMQYWTSIKRCIEESLPPTTNNIDDALLHVQEQLLVGSMQCWAAVDSPNSPVIYGIATTKVVYDECTGDKNLLLFSVTTILEHPQTLWRDAYLALSKFAKSQGCNKLIAYSNNDIMIKIAQGLGADTEWVLLTFSIL